MEGAWEVWGERAMKAPAKTSKLQPDHIGNYILGLQIIHFPGDPNSKRPVACGGSCTSV
jgi:hypothetical protein